MPTFNDFTFDEQPDYDETPEEQQEDFFTIFDDDPDPADPTTDDGSHQDPPGAGDSFQGTDPTAFNEQEELTDNETVLSNPDPISFGSQDDPEAIEDSGDEAAGDDEDDTSDQALVDSSGDIYDFLWKGSYQEQGQDADEVTAKTPERIEVNVDETPVAEVEQVANDEVVAEYKEDIYSYLIDLLDNTPGLETEVTDDEGVLEFSDDNNTIFGRNLGAEMYEKWDSLDIEGELLDALDTDVGEEFSDAINIDVGKAISRAWGRAFTAQDDPDFTIASFIIDFADIEGNVDALSFLNEFQWVDEEYI